MIDTIEFRAVRQFKDSHFLRQKYVIEGLSTRQIADLTFSSRSTISKYLKLAKIPLRPVDECRKRRPAQIPYGLKIVSGALKKKPSEQVIIGKILSLRSQNRSYREIAAILDTLDIRTKTGRSGWKAATVMKIVRSSQLR